MWDKSSYCDVDHIPRKLTRRNKTCGTYPTCGRQGLARSSRSCRPGHCIAVALPPRRTNAGPDLTRRVGTTRGVGAYALNYLALRFFTRCVRTCSSPRGIVSSLRFPVGCLSLKRGKRYGLCTAWISLRFGRRRNRQPRNPPRPQLDLREEHAADRHEGIPGIGTDLTCSETLSGTATEE